MHITQGMIYLHTRARVGIDEISYAAKVFIRHDRRSIFISEQLFSSRTCGDASSKNRHILIFRVMEMRGIKLSSCLLKISGLLAFLEVKVLGKVLI